MNKDDLGFHTQGPWTIKGPSPGGSAMDDGGDYAILAQGEIIAEVIFMTAANTFQPAEANARLIAKAPALLAALAAVEWKGERAPGECVRCVLCRHTRDNGHASDCQIHAAITDAESA